MVSGPSHLSASMTSADTLFCSHPAKWFTHRGSLSSHKYSYQSGFYRYKCVIASMFMFFSDG